MKELTIRDFPEPTLVIRMNDRTYREGMSVQELGEAVRWCWHLNPEGRVAQCHYLLAVYYLEVKEVFEISGTWCRVPDRVESMEDFGFRYRSFDAENDPGRTYITQVKVANDDLRNRYVGKSIAGLIKRGSRCPALILDKLYFDRLGK